MDLPFKSVGVSVIVHATESEEKILTALLKILPEETEIERAEAEGHYGDKKTILSTNFERRPFLREFWDKFLDRLDEKEKEKLSQEAIDRIGDDCRLYLRVDKQSLISEDKIKLTKSGNVIHLRINLSAYPAKREIAVKKMKEFIKFGLKYD